MLLALFLISPSVEIALDPARPEAERLLDIETALAAAGPVKITFRPGVHRFSRGLVIRRDHVVLEGQRGASLSLGQGVAAWKAVTRPEILSRIPAAWRSRARTARIPGSGALPGFSVRGFGQGQSASHAELRFGATPAQPARYPNTGWLLTSEPSGLSFAAPDARPAGWKDLKDVWTYGYWQFDWADSHNPLAGFEASTRKVSLGETSLAVKEYGIAKGRRFFYYHVLEELDQPGEYWMDRESREVVAIPLPGVAEISLSDDPVLRIDRARNVQVKGLALTGTRGTAITVSDSEDIGIEGCEILMPGQNGITVAGGRRVKVSRCTIAHAGQSGVSLDGGDRRSLAASGHSVEDCLIERVSRWNRTYCPAIDLKGVGQRAVGNTMRDLPHNAVHFGGNDHLIERNLVQRACTETADAGAFYTGRNFTTRGHMIRWNRFQEVQMRESTEGNWPLVISVYLDDCQAGVSVVGNIFESKGMGVLIGGGWDNVVEGNIFLGAEPAIMVDARAKGWAKTHFESGWGYRRDIDALPVTESPWKDRYPTLARALADKADLAWPRGNRIVGNVSAGGKWLQLLDGLKESDFDYRGNVVRETAMKLDEALALTKGIPVHRIGARWAGK